MRKAVFNHWFLAFGACASSGFNRGALKEQIGVENPVVTDSEIKEVLKRKPNLPRPFKLAVYIKPQSGQLASRYLEKATGRWSESYKILIQETAKELKSQKVISEVNLLSASLIQDENKVAHGEGSICRSLFRWLIEIISVYHDSEKFYRAGLGVLNQFVNHVRGLGATSSFGFNLGVTW